MYYLLDWSYIWLYIVFYSIAIYIYVNNNILATVLLIVTCQYKVGN